MLADKALMEKLHQALGDHLLQKLRDGEPTAAELNVIRQWLKDNKIEAQPGKNNSMGEIIDALPEFDDGDGPEDLPLIPGSEGP